MMYVTFDEVGGAYRAKHGLLGYYKARGITHDPSRIVLSNKRLQVDGVPVSVLEKIAKNIKKDAKIIHV